MNKSFSWLSKNFTLCALGAVWLFALFSPVYKKYDYGSGFPVMLLLVLVLVAVVFVEFKREREKMGVEAYFLMLFGIWVAISFYFSQAKHLGFSEVVAFNTVIPLYLIFAYKSNNWLKGFLKVVAFGTIAAVILGYFMYFFRPEVRMMGPFFNTKYHANLWPNAFGLFLLITWPVFLILREKVTGAGVRLVPNVRAAAWKISVLLGILLSAMFLTFSRGAMIALGGQIVLIFLYFVRRVRLNHFAHALLILAIGAGLFIGANSWRAQFHDVIDVGERVTFGNSESITSINERQDFWEGAIELAKGRPWFGWGPFSFRLTYNSFQQHFIGTSDHPHNIFLKVASESGIPAMLALFFFFFTLFAVVVARFKGLSVENREAVYFLGVAVAGGVAHNLIDYNFNFTVTWMLLFVWLAMIRSLVVKESAFKVRRSYLALLWILILGVIAIYEGWILVNYRLIAQDDSFLEKSLFPRDYYTEHADKAVESDNFDEALRLLGRQIELSPIDDRAYFLSGVVYCDDSYAGQDLELCRRDFEQAIALNPRNDFGYYRDYVRVLMRLGEVESVKELAAILEPMIEQYFVYVEYNVHFTSYTGNVEAVSELVEFIQPYLDKDLSAGVEQMWETANRQRNEKSF